MSNKNQDTIEDIVAEMRGPYYKMGRSNASLDKDMMGYMSFMANRIEAANKREIIVERHLAEEYLATKDEEIAELRECLNEAIREKCPFTRMSCKHGEPCEYECGTDKWRNALQDEGGAK